MSYPPPGPPPSQPGWSPPPTHGAPAYGGPTYGQQTQIPGLAGYGKRVGAHLIDILAVYVVVGIAVIVLISGPTELVSCDLDEEGNIAIFDEDAVQPGICEQPTGGTIAAAAGLGFLSIVFWFGYHAWEGATGKTLGKLALGIRLVDERSMRPVGGWKGIGRGVVEWLLGAATCGIGGFVDFLWPLWDDKNQTVHDKAVSGVVVDAAYMQSGPTPPATAYGAPPPQPAYGTPPQTSYPTPPAPPGYGTPPAPPAPPGSPGSPTDPFGGPAPGPPRA